MKQKQRAEKKRDLAPIFILGITIVAAVLVGIGLTRSIGTSSAQEPAPEVATLPPAEQADTHDHAAESTVRRVTVQELRAEIDQGNAVVVDVRDLGGFSAGHIPGSMHMPMETLESQLAMLPREKLIVAYCT